MVCISCFIAPVVLFLWYKFVYPILQPLIDRFIGNYQLPTPFQNLVCPMPKKNNKKNDETDKAEGDDGSEKKPEVTASRCPFAGSSGPAPHPVGAESKKDD